jgi:hypothetical protein
MFVRNTRSYQSGALDSKVGSRPYPQKLDFARKAAWLGQTLSLIQPIHKLRRKCSGGNMAPGNILQL